MTPPPPRRRFYISIFAAAACRTPGLRREITIALVAKFVALVALYLLFFSPAHRHPPDLAARIAGDAPSAVLPCR